VPAATSRGAAATVAGAARVSTPAAPAPWNGRDPNATVTQAGKEVRSLEIDLSAGVRNSSAVLILMQHMCASLRSVTIPPYSFGIISGLKLVILHLYSTQVPLCGHETRGPLRPDPIRPFRRPTIPYRRRWQHRRRHGGPRCGQASDQHKGEGDTELDFLGFLVLVFLKKIKQKCCIIQNFAGLENTLISKIFKNRQFFRKFSQWSCCPCLGAVSPLMAAALMLCRPGRMVVGSHRSWCVRCLPSPWV